MSLTPEELEIQERCEKATGGKWVAKKTDSFGDYGIWSSLGSAICFAGDEPERLQQLRRDFKFIAHAREDTPTLLSTVSALRDENERLWKAVACAGTFIEIRDGFIVLNSGYLDEEDNPELAEALRKCWKRMQAEQTATKPASTNQEDGEEL